MFSMLSGRQTLKITAHIHRKESQIYFQTENIGLVVCILPMVTIRKLEHKSKALYSEITAASL